jgi:hypothetical protein
MTCEHACLTRSNPRFHASCATSKVAVHGQKSFLFVACRAGVCFENQNKRILESMQLHLSLARSRHVHACIYAYAWRDTLILILPPSDIKFDQRKRDAIQLGRYLDRCRSHFQDPGHKAHKLLHARSTAIVRVIRIISWNSGIRNEKSVTWIMER